MSLPLLRWSRVAKDLARRTGLRVVMTITAVPRRMLLVKAEM